MDITSNTFCKCTVTFRTHRIKINFKYVMCEDVGWIDQLGCCKCVIGWPYSIRDRDFHDLLSDCELLKKDCSMNLFIHPHICTENVVLSNQWCKHLNCQFGLVTKLCTVEPNIFGPPVWNLPHFTLLVPRILRWLLYILKICVLLS
jgi:hypothetical protein